MSNAEGVRNCFADRFRGATQTQGVETHLLSDNLDLLFQGGRRNEVVELLRAGIPQALIVVPRSNEEDNLHTAHNPRLNRS